MTKVLQLSKTKITDFTNLPRACFELEFLKKKTDFVRRFLTTYWNTNDELSVQNYMFGFIRRKMTATKYERIYGQLY